MSRHGLGGGSNESNLEALRTYFKMILLCYCCAATCSYKPQLVLIIAMAICFYLYLQLTYIWVSLAKELVAVEYIWHNFIISTDPAMHFTTADLCIEWNGMVGRNGTFISEMVLKSFHFLIKITSKQRQSCNKAQKVYL